MNVTNQKTKICFLHGNIGYRYKQNYWLQMKITKVTPKIYACSAECNWKLIVCGSNPSGGKVFTIETLSV